MTEIQQDDTIDIFAIINPILERWKFVMIFSFSVMLLTAFAVLFKKGVFKAEVKLFVGQSSDPMSSIGTSAFGERGGQDIYKSDFGLDASKFYQEILKSRPFLTSLAAIEIESPGAEKITAYDFLKLDSSNPLSQEEASNALASMISVKTDKGSGIMSIEVRSEDPGFSMSFANILTSELEKFSLDFLLKRSRTKRMFVETRLKESEAKLKRSEDAFNMFVKSNRMIENSSSLKLMEDKLKRELSLEQEIYLSFAKELEKIRLDEKREISPLIVLEYAILPHGKDGMSRKKMVLVSGFAGLLISFFLAFIIEFFKKLEKENSEEYRKFRKNVDRIRKEIQVMIFRKPVVEPQTKDRP